MEVEFADTDLDRLEVDPKFTGGFAPAIVRGFRKAMQAIRAAHDERDLYVSRGLGFEKLKGKRSHQCSVRLNKQWRLILELQGGEKLRKARIVGIEDYH
jgi:proteic killer suppression protein